MPSAVLAGLSGLIRELGGNPAAVGASVGIPAEALDRPDIPIPASAVYRIIDRAGEACRCRDFGLRLAGRSSLAVLGPLWILLRSSGTVRQLLDELVANEDVFTRASKTTLTPVGDGLLLAWEPLSGMADSTVQLTEFVLALGCNELRTHCDASYQPADVVFRHDAAPDMSAHHRVFGPNVRFNQDRNGILIERATLAMPLNLSNSRTRVLMRAALRLDDESPGKGTANRVEGIVRALLPYAPCTVTEVGKALGLSERTLQNHLGSEGQSFKSIKDEGRRACRSGSKVSP
jgi:hypothetical protein